jgi:hypothetical protein
LKYRLPLPKVFVESYGRGENMKKIIQFTTAGVCVLILVLAAGCASSPQQGAGGNSQVTANPWIGVWEGIEDGNIFSFHFTATNWESYIESSGVSLPFYRGTYTFTASRVNLQVTEEGNYDTMGWMPNRSNFPSITGRLTGNILSIPTFTEADLLKE